MDSGLKRWVTADGCQVSRRVFTDEQVYQREKQRIFGRNWLYLAHESQLKSPGDFVTAYMGETPVIVARGDDGGIHVSVNSCSHRGVPVCRADLGNAKRFVCPYHNWSYAVTGELVALPQERKVQSCADKTTLGLKAVPRVESLYGLIFGSFNPEIEPLADYLGEMRFYLETFFERFPAGVEVVGAPHKWLLNANWKLPVENQLGDVGHGPYLHGSLLAGTPAVAELEEYGFNVVPKPGHGAAVRLMPADAPLEKTAWGIEGVAAYNAPAELTEYLLETQRRVKERLNPVQARIKGLTYGVYPNLSLLWANSTLRVSHPRGPGKVEYWSWWLVPADAPGEIKALLRSNYITFFGPGGLLEQEDAAAWSEQYRGSNIDFMDDTPYYYGLGAGDETDHPELPGRVGSCYNEHYARQFYIRWRQDMLAGEGAQ